MKTITKFLDRWSPWRLRLRIKELENTVKRLKRKLENIESIIDNDIS